MYRLLSRDVFRIQEPRSVGCGRRTRVLAISVACVTIALIVSAGGFTQEQAGASRQARVEHACAVIMGLHRPGNPYDTCVRGLERNLSELDRAQMAASGRTACLSHGYQPGTPVFATCEVSAEEAVASTGGNSALATTR